jgi:glycosyltransferase involved in cell wall biosynthesis
MIKNKKTIVFFNGVYLPHLGGVERYTYELATRLKDDYNVIIVTTNTENIAPISTEDGVKVFRLPVKGLFKNRFPKFKKNEEFKVLLSEIRALRIDRIFINTRFYDTTFLGLKIAKEKGIEPAIIDHSGGYVLKAYEKAIIPRIKKYKPVFYSVSKTNQDFLRHEFGIKSKNIFYNAIDSKNDFKKVKNERIRILYSGRLIKEKGVIDILEAYRKIKNHVNADLIVVGDGPLLKSAKAKYKGVHFLGHIDHDKVMKLFKSSDIFAFPTQYCEGFPTVILEAGINKCAVLIYDEGGGGTNELVGGEKNGAITKRKDKEDLKRKLERLIVDDSYRKEKQENLFRRVNENYNWKKTIKVIKEEIER